MKTTAKAGSSATTTPARKRAKGSATEDAAPFHPVTDAELAALDALGKEGVWRIGEDERKLTNLDKPLFQPRTTACASLRHWS